MNLVTTAQYLASQTWIDQPDADIERYVASLGRAEPRFDLREKLVQWQRDGYVTFEQVIAPQLIDALIGDIDYLRRHYRDFDLIIEISGQQKKIAEVTDAELNLPGLKFNSIQTLSMAAIRLSLTAEITSFLQHIFGAAPAILQTLTFYRGSQQPIHVDYPYVRCQTRLAHLAASWIPLEDVLPEAGPLAYYPGSHRPDVTGFFDWGQGSILYEPDSTRHPADLAHYLMDKVRQAGIPSKVFCPRKGDLLIWHGNLAHEGTAILRQDLTRKSHVTHYTSLDAYPPLHRHRHAKAGDGAVVESGGYAFEYPWLKSKRKLPSWGRP